MYKRIVIASILKPIDDTRMYEKIGISLSNTNKYEVNIIGFYSKKIRLAENICFFPLFNFSRLSLFRLLAPLKYFRKLLKVKPELIIVTTPELLPITFLYKQLYSCKIIYDIQENYHANIIFNNIYPKYIKYTIARIVRKIEVAFSKYTSFFLLAEACYQKELDFIGKKFVVLENKYKEFNNIPSYSKKKGKIHLIYSGTIAKNYGILEAIHLTKILHQHLDNIYLTIAGYCAKKDLLDKVISEISGCDFIHLIGGNQLVPHNEILGLIKIADFGLVPYQPNQSLYNKIPTKLYEYLANKLPVIIQNHQFWVSFCEPYKAIIAIDYNSIDVLQIIKNLKSENFYTLQDHHELLWESEEKKLLEAIESCFKE